MKRRRGIATVDDLRAHSVVDPATHCWHYHSGSGRRPAIWVLDLDKGDMNSCSAPRAVWYIAHRSKLGRQVAWMACGTVDCVCPAHVRSGSRAAANAALKARGVFAGSTPRRVAAARAGRLARGVVDLPDDVVLRVHSLSWQPGLSGSAIARRLGLGKNAALRILAGISYRHVLASAAVAIGTQAGAAAVCSWDRPGHNPFSGDVVAAVDRYTDLPADTRARLKARMARRQYDEIVTIRRDSITGRGSYSDTITDMHFGRGQVCATVTRARWTDAMVERGLVYCEGPECIIVPTVCRNVARVLQISPSAGIVQRADAGGAVPGAAGGESAGAGMRAAPPVFDWPTWPAPAPLPGWVPPGAGPAMAPTAYVAERGPVLPVPLWRADWSAGPGQALDWPDVIVLPAPVPAVPEPATIWLACLGVALLLRRVARHCNGRSLDGLKPCAMK